MRILSLGAGVQSTTVLLMAIHGAIEPIDRAIFADTGWEPKAVYEHLDWLNGVADGAGVPIDRITQGNIRDDSLTAGSRSASLPLYVRNENDGQGKLRRQCTKEYKIMPIRHRLRELVGDGNGKPLVTLLIGISLDEYVRAKHADVKWITHEWPLIDKRMTRWDCERWLDAHGYPLPPKSSCIGCPFHDDGYWRKMKDETPGEFADAVDFDARIRDGATFGRAGLRGNAYLHSDLVPLNEVDLSTAEDHGQSRLFDEECEGMCGV